MSWFQELLDGEYRLCENTSEAVLTRLYEIPQEPAVHGEGSVGVHTEMVLSEMETLIAADDRIEPQVARLAAALHDVGKPETTKITRSGRIAAPGHHEAGFQLAGELFDEDPALRNLTQEVKAAVRALIRAHLWAYQIDEVSRGAMLRLAHLTHPRTAWALWRADAAGRIAEDRGRLLEGVDYAWEVLAENGADTHAPWPYWDEARKILGEGDHSDLQVRSELLRAVIREGVTSQGQATAFVADRSRRRGGHLIYTIGLPGAGKSSLCGRLAEETGRRHLRYDAVRKRDRATLRAENWTALRKVLGQGETVLVGATHLERRQRDPLIAAAFRARAQVSCLLFDVRVPEALRRQRGREASVPEEAIREMARKFRYPTPDEYGEMLVVSEETTFGEVMGGLGS